MPIFGRNISFSSDPDLMVRNNVTPSQCALITNARSMQVIYFSCDQCYFGLLRMYRERNRRADARSFLQISMVNWRKKCKLCDEPCLCVWPLDITLSGLEWRCFLILAIHQQTR
ncbi:hypothetical protein I7I53_01088 [Histoplasma capsulatum var. duboisii H88]|uniref:Uncharacterized protein n=1 Tax=Ajellomyces capsulatus (strain H88) TaxID=544711 RepID=A0A8A1LP84_AJEC8|nr:hypothetical protein I7I53_01088 [Histoplasma capsulatum var. duboisii H88]